MDNIEAIAELTDIVNNVLGNLDAHTKEAFLKAISALNLHTPKAPYWQGDDKCIDPYCPNCGEILDDYENPCDNCSQLIRW